MTYATRRSVLHGALTGGLTLAAAGRIQAARPKRGGFPTGFLWGAGTSAYQAEGNNIGSDWWLLESLAEAGFAEVSGDACDHYHRFGDDVRLLAGLGLNSYRFSIEWARVEPRAGQFSMAELNHYRRVLLACRAAGLKTVVTLHHFTAPLWFAARGGFMCEANVAAFARYADQVVRHCGDLIDYLTTINEANLSFAAFVPPEQVSRLRTAARRQSGWGDFDSFLFDDVSVSKPIVRKAHAAARQAAKAIRPALAVGLTLALDDIQDAPGGRGAADRVRSELYDVWLEAVRGDDYLGVQNYSRLLYDQSSKVVPPPVGIPLTQLRQEFYPAGLGNAIRYAAKVAGVPILVTENGIGTDDDQLRVRYIGEALGGLKECIRDGIDVRGYLHWSLLDNFEWAFGYSAKFGLVAVDRATQGRMPKPSATLLGQIARRNDV